MSMNTYPMEALLAFQVDEQVAAYLNRPGMLQDLNKPAHLPKPGTLLTPMQQVEATMRKILADDARFAKEIRPDSAMRQALEDYDLFNIGDASCRLQEEDINNLCYMSEFDGEIQKLDSEGHATGESVNYNDDYVLLLLPERNLSYFRAAYMSMDDFITELKIKLDGLLPENFNYAAHIVSVSGTYFC